MKIPSATLSPFRLARGAMLVAGAFFGAATLAQAGVPFPTAATPAARDLGALAARQTPITVSVLLKLRDQDQLEALVTAQHTPGSAQFRQFLTPDQVAQRFGPSPAAVAAAVAHFRSFGLATALESGRLLKVTGNAAAIEAAFQVHLHDFAVAAHGKTPAYTFRSPDVAPRIAAAAVAANVEGIFGIDTQPAYRPLMRKSAMQPAKVQHAPSVTTTPNEPGSWTVADFAAYYNVTGAYAQGLSGAGRTLAIVTLAAFAPSDAFLYWNFAGVPVDPTRITVVDIDGGPGAPSDDSGSIETTLDVEQSGGLAPGAKIVVYQAPNTDQGFVDAFAKAINDNMAESFSASWGLWEFFDTENSVRQRRMKTSLAAYTSLFLQAAAQGQSGFVASGDAGAYEVNRANLPPDFSKTLSVGSPGSTAWITAAGGTTLAGTQTFGGGLPSVTIPTEQAWGWSYLHDLCTILGLDDISCGIFPAGSGGGVSSFIKAPSYQAGLAGLRVTEAGQTFTDFTVDPPEDIVTLPAGFAGRNVPDVSANADPDTGYVIVYTSDQQGGTFLFSFEGGTSFVAPQFNGVASLAAEAVNGRVGLWNFPLYRLAKSGLGYRGMRASLHDITAGDNWFYSGVAGYEPAAGVGTLDVTNFINVLSRGQ